MRLRKKAIRCADADKYIAERQVQCLFLMEDGKLHTPLADCFLNGITRRTIIDLTKEQGLEVVERYMMQKKPGNRMFLNGTAAEVTPFPKSGSIARPV